LVQFLAKKKRDCRINGDTTDGFIGFKIFIKRPARIILNYDIINQQIYEQNME